MAASETKYCQESRLDVIRSLGDCCDEEYAECLQEWWDSVWADAYVHNKSFDNNPDRRSPIKYDTYPFVVPELNCEPPE